MHLTNYLFLCNQTNRRALATDEWLRVEGCNNVYALGDCATINQRKVMVPLLVSILLHFLCIKSPIILFIYLFFFVLASTVTIHLIYCQLQNEQSLVYYENYPFLCSFSLIFFRFSFVLVGRYLSDI